MTGDESTGSKKRNGGAALNEFLQNIVKNMQAANLNTSRSPLGTPDTDISHNDQIIKIEFMLMERNSAMPEVYAVEVLDLLWTECWPQSMCNSSTLFIWSWTFFDKVYRPSIDPVSHLRRHELAANISQHAATNTSVSRSSIPKRRGRGPGVNNVINGLNTTNDHSRRLAPGVTWEVFDPCTEMTLGVFDKHGSSVKISTSICSKTSLIKYKKHLTNMHAVKKFVHEWSHAGRRILPSCVTSDDDVDQASVMF
ncbi:uncharacterized protein LOC108218416 isoform X2 [Daucus carota subsp. sativus]|uniref:uncharacterized protein LOC108218416 isoform X2 n=1 Tax=Daucus carota subsp. sativus TaxID=79200 RepID=UPI003082B13F